MNKYDDLIKGITLTVAQHVNECSICKRCYNSNGIVKGMGLLVVNYGICEECGDKLNKLIN